MTVSNIYFFCIHLSHTQPQNMSFLFMMLYGLFADLMMSSPQLMGMKTLLGIPKTINQYSMSFWYSPLFFQLFNKVL